MKAWRETTLGAICAEVDGEIQTGPFGSQLHESDYAEEGVPVVMPKDIREGLITTDSIARVESHHAKRLSRYVLREGDIVFGRRGDIGRQALARKEQDGWLCGTGCLLVRLGHSVVDPLWLHFFLKQDEVVGWLAGQAIGATLPNLNTSILHGVPIRLPDLPTQRRIAGILSAYDELIANNQRRIAVLEQMARALYREWFVYFRFPAEASAKAGAPGVRIQPGSELPEGWDVKALPELAEVTYGSPFDSKQFNTTGEGTPLIRIRDIPNGVSATWTTQEASEKYHVSDGEILVGMDGDFHMCLWSSGHAYQNQRVAKFTSRGAIGNYHLFLALEKPIQELNRAIVGTTVAHLGAMHIKEIKVIMPTTDVLERAKAILEPIAEQQLILKKQTANLRRTRDLLLPRLMSGRVEVNTLEYAANN